MKLLPDTDPHVPENHLSVRSGWLRAAVLGANDGIVSTASLLVGVASYGASNEYILIAGTASLVAGAMSMAAGEYVSVSSQLDAERADLEIERRELRENPDYETAELTAIYVRRGLDSQLARQVAEQLMAVDPLSAHARDELGISRLRRPRPVQAAFASMTAFASGAIVPLLVAVFASPGHTGAAVAVATMLSLAGLGMISSRLGGASMLRGALRVSFWGALAMVLTSAIGALAGLAF
jgi:VIT1/CCC1 family predicted Fe2+/Mn2+ transporter